MYPTKEMNHYSEILLGSLKPWCTQKAHLFQGTESGQWEKTVGGQQEVDEGENRQSKELQKTGSSKMAGEITLSVVIFHWLQTKANWSVSIRIFSFGQF